MKKRHQNILDHLEENGACSYQEFSEQFGVTVMTIRRDADYLAGKGLVIKILGGVQKAGAPSYYYESSLQSRVNVNSVDKCRIAESAVELVSPGKTLFLDGSTTSLHLASLLAEQKKGLTIITNSAVTALELSKSSENMVVGIGGQIDRDTASFLGPSAEEQASKFFVDIAFMSTKGFIPTEGTFESSFGNLRIKQLIVSQAAESVLLVDHTKFGCRALCKAVDISDIGIVVTDDTTTQADLDLLYKQGKEVRIPSKRLPARKHKKGEVVDVT